ncbi:MAG TPA: hypothetical protein DDW50_19420 [Firmicutes bacterium]|nr:hypothetical protein [Bacillota bacterium]
MVRYRYLFYGLLVLVALSVSITINAVDQNNTGEVPRDHLNNQIFNEYVAEMIKSREPEIKAAVLSNENITDFRLNDALFDIETGKVTLEFTVWYKQKDISGTLGFEVRTSSHEDAMQIGGYCLGLEGKLHSANRFTNIMLAFTKNHLNRSLAGREFWPDKQNHPYFQVFKNANLADIINQAMSNGAMNQQFPKMDQSIPGGTLQVEFHDIVCRSFDSNAGQAEVDSTIAMNLHSGFTGDANIPNAGSLEAFFDLYVNPADQSWWAKLNALKIKMNLSSDVNKMVQKAIDKHLKSHQVWIALNMPKVNP